MCLVVILDGEESEKYRGLSLLVSGLLPGWYCWYWFVSAAICVSASISRQPGNGRLHARSGALSNQPVASWMHNVVLDIEHFSGK